MRVTLWKPWKPGLFIINRAENKRVISINIFSFGFKNCSTSKYFCIMIFEYFVFSTVYIQNVFSGVAPLCNTLSNYARYMLQLTVNVNTTLSCLDWLCTYNPWEFLDWSSNTDGVRISSVIKSIAPSMPQTEWTLHMCAVR